MQRCIIGVLLEAYPEDSIESRGGGRSAVDVEETLTYLDGKEIQHGVAGQIDTADEEIVEINDTDVIIDERERRQFRSAEFFCDVSEGYFAVDSSDGEFLFGGDGLLNLRYNMPVERGVLDVSAFAEYLQERYEPTWWQVGWREEDGDETIDAGVSYHRGTRKHSPTKENTSQLGFSFRRSNGERVRGTCAESGYVELYDPEWSPSAMARWLVDDVLPFVSMPAEPDEPEQSTLEDGLCERCENHEAMEHYQGSELCLVCYDKLTEEAPADE